MKKIEIITILDTNNVTAGGAKEIAFEILQNVIEKANENTGATLEHCDLLYNKPLAYTIKNKNVGTFAMFFVTGTDETISQIKLGLKSRTDDNGYVLKFIIIENIFDGDDAFTPEEKHLNFDFFNVDNEETGFEQRNYSRLIQYEISQRDFDNAQATETANAGTNTDEDNNEEEDDENVVFCADCGERINIDEDDYICTADGDYICEGCRDNYFYCEHCEEWHSNDEQNTVRDRHGDEHWVCDDCLSNFYYCEDCDCYYEDEDCGTYNANGDFVCNDCAESSYTRCDFCGELYPEDDVCYDEDTDCYYCSDCEEDNDERRRELLGESDDVRILNYHEFRDWKLYFDAIETLESVPFYIGFELETIQKHYTADSTDRQTTALETLSKNLNVVMAHDSSLDEGWGGFEIISHPQSFKYLMNQKETYKKVFDELIQLGYVSHESGCCGLHFHVTRPADDEIVDRIWLIMETYKKQIVELSRRRNCELEHWAKFLSDRTYSDEDKEKLKALYFIKKTDKKSTRYMALNNTNEKTIEFRFFKGTLKYETFFACVEFINNLMTLCSDKKIPVSKITWDKLTNGEFIKAYVYEKNILTTIKPKDNSLELIRRENKQKAIMQKINKILFNYAKRKLAGIDTNRGELSNLNNFFEKTATMRNRFFELYDTAEYLNVLHSRQQNGETKQYLTRLNDLMNYNSENIWRNLTEEEKTEISTLKLQLESI